MALEIIPVDVEDVAFTARYLLDDEFYEFRFYISEREDRYYFDMFLADGEAISHGSKVVPGVDLLDCMDPLKRPPGRLLAVDQGLNDGILRPPTAGELGQRVALIYVTQDETSF